MSPSGWFLGSLPLLGRAVVTAACNAVWRYENRHSSGGRSTPGTRVRTTRC